MSDQPADAPGLSFVEFVIGLATNAAVHFGDIPDPFSGEKKSEPNLDGATQVIEILSLLELKTRGNLTPEERQVLEQVLFELRMRFVTATNGNKRIIEP
jgi:hypothetical protein